MGTEWDFAQGSFSALNTHKGLCVYPWVCVRVDVHISSKLLGKVLIF